MILTKCGSKYSIRILLTLTALLISGCSDTELPKVYPISTGPISIIPQPVSIARLPGEFTLSAETRIIATDDVGIRKANQINKLLLDNCGFKLNVIGAPEVANSIILSTKETREGENPEGYFLRIDTEQIRITGTESGLFYGAQSLIQMIPKDMDNGIHIPAAMITDAPRFRYRGFHLDEARHFMGADFVKKYIALAARYKLNYFHWHLTDDQGWRIAIEKHPRLTEVGSKRRESVKAATYLKRQPYVGDGKPVEDYYTREQIADIVAFAEAHSVTIIPEIEMPGHSSAALAAYHELGCMENYQYKVQTTWGNPPAGFTDILCPSEATITFLDDVLDEVMEMFPDSPYIHIGGDETNLSQWKSSKVVQDIKTREGFTNEYQVLRWFIDEIAAHVESHGRKIICWDDLIEKGQYPNATIMSWKGSEIGKLAALHNREVIIVPYERLYFDHPQSTAADEAKSLGPVVTLKSVYDFSVVPARPIPEETRNIIGGEGCVWTEFIDTPKRAEYMAFPRTIALAEVLWSPPQERSAEGFFKRLVNELSNLDREKVNYRVPGRLELKDMNLDKLIKPMNSESAGRK